MKKKIPEIKDYDGSDTSEWIDHSQRLSLKDIGFKLPPSPPTQVVSLRLPTRILNALRARASGIDIPYQALIKMVLARFVGQTVRR